MLEINIDTRAILAALDAAPGQLRYATSQAINKTAWDVRDALKKEMPVAFNQDGKPPTPFTVNSLKVLTSKTSDLTVDINFKGKPSDHYLRPEVFGGNRPMKMFEKRIGSYLIPGKEAPLDRYGNVTGGQIMRMLSVLGMARMGQNQTVASGKRKMRTLAGVKEFVVIDGNVYERVPEKGKAISAKARKGLKPGVYQKGADGSAVKASGLKLWFFKAKKAPTYQPRFKFNEVSKRVIDERLATNIKKAIAMAFKRAGV